MDSAKTDWEKFYSNKAKGNYPQWPNETVLKLVFGNYLGDPVRLDPGSRILDVGCGFGQNLIPFLAEGYECYGVEVTPETARRTQEILEERGFQPDIRRGSNANLGFEDNFFDLLLSINVIHYESDEDRIRLALKEHQRVLKPGGRAVFITVGPSHEIIKKARPLGGHRYLIQGYDFRDGQTFFYFDHERYLKMYLSDFFQQVETGKVNEQLMTRELDFLVAVCRKA